ncbi:MAG: type II toxin-antitoxin system VapC family toxin [Bacteroidota bacterium]
MQWPPEEVLISVVTEWEVLAGARNKQAYDSLRKALKRYNIIELGSEISQHAGILLKTYQLSHGMSIPDALIAATSIKYGLKLKTSNIKDFQFIPGLELMT